MIILEPRWKSYIVETTNPVLTPQQCDELIRIGQSEPKINGTVWSGKAGATKVDNQYRKSIISWIPFFKAETIYSDIKQCLEVTNNNNFGFDSLQL